MASLEPTPPDEYSLFYGGDQVKYRKKPIVIEAVRWCVHGDHENVQPYRGLLKLICAYCRKPYSDHGWINTSEGGHMVCPGDWIITDAIVGEVYPCKPDVFRKTYEKAGE